MMEKLLQAISDKYPLEKLDCGEYATQKLNGMTFKIRAFHAKGLGHVSAMTATGFFGLMKMDTLILNPTEIDLPLLSYDRVLAMGNDTLIFELYDTLLGETDLGSLELVKESYGLLPDHDLGEHWYDDIKLPASLSKKGKKQHRSDFDGCTAAYLKAFLELDAPLCDGNAKREKAKAYSEGLLTHGGPSTDVFMKALGREKTEKLFRKVLFGTEV